VPPIAVRIALSPSDFASKHPLRQVFVIGQRHRGQSSAGAPTRGGRPVLRPAVAAKLRHTAIDPGSPARFAQSSFLILHDKNLRCCRRVANAARGPAAAAAMPGMTSASVTSIDLGTVRQVPNPRIGPLAGFGDAGPNEADSRARLTAESAGPNDSGAGNQDLSGARPHGGGSARNPCARSACGVRSPAVGVIRGWHF
jgi:hypothetical protein